MKTKLFALAAGALLAGSVHAQSTGARTPDADKLEAAADNLVRMKASLKQVLGRAEQARNEKDVVKLNCVNEKLTQVKSLIKVAEQADIALHESVATRDAGGEAEFSKIAIARTKVDGLRGEAEQCIGQLAYMVDEKTTVEVEQPSNLPAQQQGGGLGVANRGENPADLVARIGYGVGDDRGPWGERRGGPGDRRHGGHGWGGSGWEPPPCPPPVRPPHASPFR